MPRRRPNPAVGVLALAAACAILPTPADARVFFRWGAVRESRRALEAAGGKLAYEADITLNGGEASLAVFGFEKPTRELVGELGRTFPAAGWQYGGGSLGHGLVREDGRVLRLVVVRPDPRGRTLVFSLDQTQADYEASREPPAKAGQDGLPSWPDGRTLFHAADRNARMSLTVSLARTDAAAARAFFSGQLTATGWSAALPGGRRAPGPGLDVYMKGQDICCVLAEGGEDGEARITLLHKQARMK